MLKYE